MKKAIIYIHGKGGSAEESEHYRQFFQGADVIGFAYTAETPWEAKTEFPRFFDMIAAGYDSVSLIANSIGAFFAMTALADKPIEQAMLISPIVNMERLITDMMTWAGVTEEELNARRKIPTTFGETLSWEYLCYVREHPIRWSIPTQVLYGENDNLTSYETVSAFVGKTGAGLTVMKNGEHWFHTEEQMCFLDGWMRQITHSSETNHNQSEKGD